jgi:hypothetical protein
MKSVWLAHDTSNLTQFELTKAFASEDSARSFCQDQNLGLQEDRDEGPWQYHKVTVNE